MATKTEPQAYVTMDQLDQAFAQDKISKADYLTLAKDLRQREKDEISKQAGKTPFSHKIVPPGVSKKTGKPYKSVVEIIGNHRPTNVGPAMLRELVEWITKDNGKAAIAACDKCAALNAARE